MASAPDHRRRGPRSPSPMRVGTRWLPGDRRAREDGRGQLLVRDRQDSPDSRPHDRSAHERRRHELLQRAGRVIDAPTAAAAARPRLKSSTAGLPIDATSDEALPASAVRRPAHSDADRHRQGRQQRHQRSFEISATRPFDVQSQTPWEGDLVGLYASDELGARTGIGTTLDWHWDITAEDLDPASFDGPVGFALLRNPAGYHAQLTVTDSVRDTLRDTRKPSPPPMSSGTADTNVVTTPVPTSRLRAPRTITAGAKAPRVSALERPGASAPSRPSSSPGSWIQASSRATRRCGIWTASETSRGRSPRTTMR